MDETLNDIDRQALKLNARIIREVGYERDAKDALQAVARFKETYHKCYIPSPASEGIFRLIISYLNRLADLKPAANKPRREANDPYKQ